VGILLWRRRVGNEGDTSVSGKDISFFSEWKFCCRWFFVSQGLLVKNVYDGERILIIIDFRKDIYSAFCLLYHV
jgi:hypothetical protein